MNFDQRVDTLGSAKVIILAFSHGIVRQCVGGGCLPAGDEKMKNDQFGCYTVLLNEQFYSPPSRWLNTVFEQDYDLLTQSHHLSGDLYERGSS